MIFNSKLSAALECAIDHLNRIEQSVNCDGSGQLSPMVNEQVTLFFDHLTKFSNLLLIKDNTNNSVAFPISSLSNVEYYGVYKYSSHKCRKVESNLESITIRGTEYTGGSPSPESTFYLSTLLGTDVYYAPLPPTNGIMIDKDDISMAICQLRNHYRAINRFL